MSLKELMSFEEIYKITRELQHKKIKAAVSKNQLIFLEKCLTHDVTQKSFKIKPPIKSQKATRITKEYRKKLLVLAKNDAKQRLRNYNIEVNDSSQELRSVLSDVHFEIIERITINQRKEEKYQNLAKGNKIQKTTGNKSLFKPAVLNLTNQEIPQHHLELLNFGPKFVPSNNKLPFQPRPQSKA